MSESIEKSEIIDSFELSNKMLVDIGKYFVAIKPEFVDLSRLKYYEDKFNSFEHLPASELGTLALETIRAMDLAINYHYIATRFSKYGHIQYDRVAGMLFLTQAEVWLKQNGAKDSIEARKKFVDQHPDYTNVKLLRDSWEALADLLYQKKDIFLQRHMWVKKCIDQLSNNQTGIIL